MNVLKRILEIYDRKESEIFPVFTVIQYGIVFKGLKEGILPRKSMNSASAIYHGQTVRITCRVCGR